MVHELTILYLSAAAIGLVHTVLGPDHYLPFIAMARVRDWSRIRTFWITALCGVGHVLGSVALGLVGLLFGISVARLEGIESARGDLAGWLLLIAGVIFFAWGIRQAIRNRPHTHLHVHDDGIAHRHQHVHQGGHLHVHEATVPAAVPKRRSVTPWVLFTIFLFGPCEPLIPLLMYPAAAGNLWHAAGVSLVFAVVTIGTMTGLVMTAREGLAHARWHWLERYGHAAAGLVVMLSGAAVVWGW